MTTPMNPMYASMGLTVAQGVAGFAQAGIASKLARSMQKYNNEMRDLTAAMSRDVITRNEIATKDASRSLSFDIAQRAARDQGAAAVSAAAAGVSGRSVDRQMRGLRGSALSAQAARKARTSQEMAAHFQERTTNNVSRILGRDIQVHSRPSMLAHLGGIGVTLFDQYQAAQPPGDKLGDPSQPPLLGEELNQAQVDWWQT